MRRLSVSYHETTRILNKENSNKEVRAIGLSYFKISVYQKFIRRNK